MYLNPSIDSLEIKLGGAVTTTQLSFYVSYFDGSQIKERSGSTNNTIPVKLVPISPKFLAQEVDSIIVTNLDSVNATVTVQLSTSGVKTILLTRTIAPAEVITYDGTVFLEAGGSGAVTATQSGVWDITDITGTISLPTGASTAAKQDTGNTSLASIDAKLTNPLPISGTVTTGGLTDAQLRATPVPISGTFWQATQPVSAASLPLPTGAAIAANQQTDALTDTELRATDVKITLDGETVPVTGTFWQATQPVSNTNLDVALSTRLKPADTLAGVTALGSITGALPTGNNIIGQVKLTDGTDTADILDLTNSNPLTVAIVDTNGDQVGSFGGGTQYTEGDTDASITGTAILWEDAGNTLKPVASGSPLPVNIVAGSSSGVQYTEGDTDASITGTAILMEVAANTVQPVQGTVADGLLVNLGSNNDVTVTGSVTANAGTNLNTSSLALEATLQSVKTAVETIDNAISGSEMQVDVLTMPTTTVQATDLDIRNLVFATDKVDASGTTLGANSGVDIGDVTINNAAGASAVNIQDGGNSITIDGSLTTVSTVTAVTAITNALPAGTNNIGDVDVLTLPVAFNTGTVSATTQRVFIATDQTVIPVSDNSSSLTVDAPLATPVNVQIGNGTLSAGVIDETGASAVDALAIGGATAHDAVDSGNPIKIGGKAFTSVPTPIADADRVNGWFDEYGRQVVSDKDNELGLTTGTTGLRDHIVAQRCTVLSDSLADGISAFWTQTAANGGTFTSTVGEGQLKTSTAATGSMQAVSPNVPYYPGQVAWLNSAVRFGDTGTVGNIRRIGMFTVSGTTPQDGFYYELSATTLNAVYVKAGSATAVASTSWSRFSIAPFTLDTNYHSFEIRYTANTIWFYIDNVLRHAVSGTSAALTTTLSLPIVLQNIKTSGGTDITFAIRNIGNGRFGQNGGTVSETGLMAVDAIAVGGGTPHDSVDSGSPIKIGGKASTNMPTAVADNDRVNASFTTQGALRVYNGISPLFKGRAATFRTLGRAGTAGQKILSIHNATGSAVTVDVTKVTVDVFCTVVKAITTAPPIVRLWKVTVLPTNGTALTKNKTGGSTTSNASVTLLQDSSADGTGSGTTLTATLPAGTIVAQEVAPRFITAAGYEMADRMEFLGGGEVITLAALEGLVVFLDYTAAGSNPVTDMWFAGIEWIEY